jgi:hypothetical protein
MKEYEYLGLILKITLDPDSDLDPDPDLDPDRVRGNLTGSRERTSNVLDRM